MPVVGDGAGLRAVRDAGMAVDAGTSAENGVGDFGFTIFDLRAALPNGESPFWISPNDEDSLNQTAAALRPFPQGLLNLNN